MIAVTSPFYSEIENFYLFKVFAHVGDEVIITEAAILVQISLCNDGLVIVLVVQIK